ncbi:MAG: hypothetical protein JWQ38_2099 [Flavipsychrobacter sp.]|nr:hypothetical protein [Flavipsychrobacter sp.]
MNDEEINIDTYCRLASLMIEKFGVSYNVAIDRLNQLTLLLECGSKISTCLSLQAALLTSVNAGKRAFLGGVYVSLPKDTPCLLPWPNIKNLNEIIEELGGIIIEDKELVPSFTLKFDALGNVDKKSLQVVCNNWQGGVISGTLTTLPEETEVIPIGGIAGGAIGVGIAFLIVTGIDISAGDKPTGISIWRPDIDWLDPEAKGDKVNYLPKKYWLLGLGHLGQAFVWAIGLLPYPKPSQVSIMLQDYDQIVSANWSAGLLSEKSCINQYKTRVCQDWLEKRGFETKITERKFDEFTKRTGEEPHIAFCGFDNAKSRTLIENAGFDLIIEAALGANLSMFDEITIHTFPSEIQTANKLWAKNEHTTGVTNPSVLKYFLSLENDGCGIIANNIANKAISSSFVGALATAMAIGALIRALHCGYRYDKIDVQIRNLKNRKAISSRIAKYTGIELSKDGYLKI